MSGKQIFITEFDRDRLELLLEENCGAYLAPYLDALRSELDRAKIVPSREISAEVITMNSTISLTDVDTGEAQRFTLVFPNEADASRGKISIIAPLGTAMLGYRVGEVFEWTVPIGTKRWRIDRIIYQPEAAGDFHL